MIQPFSKTHPRSALSEGGWVDCPAIGREYDLADKDPYSPNRERITPMFTTNPKKLPESCIKFYLERFFQMPASVMKATQDSG